MIELALFKVEGCPWCNPRICVHIDPADPDKTMIIPSAMVKGFFYFLTCRSKGSMDLNFDEELKELFAQTELLQHVWRSVYEEYKVEWERRLSS